MRKSVNFGHNDARIAAAKAAIAKAAAEKAAAKAAKKAAAEKAAADAFMRGSIGGENMEKLASMLAAKVETKVEKTEAAKKPAKVETKVEKTEAAKKPAKVEKTASTKAVKASKVNKMTFTVSSVVADGTPIDLIVDGSIRGATYKWHFDHHRKGGAPVQMLEYENGVAAVGARSIGTHMLDADAVVAAVWATVPGLSNRARDRMLALAWVCDHLHIPAETGLDHSLEGWALDVIEGLKVQTTKEAQKKGITLFGPNTSPAEVREPFMAKMFERQYRQVRRAAREHRWGLLPVAPANQAIERMCDRLQNEGRVVGNLVDIRGIETFVNPLSYYRLMPTERVAIVYRDFLEGEGLTFTVGANPLAGKVLDLSPVLAEIQKIQPAWGGRATVFGSPFKEASKLSPEQVQGIVEEFLKSVNSPKEVNMDAVLFRSIFGRTPEAKGEKKPNLPCIGKAWLTSNGHMMWSSKVQPGDYRGEMPSIDDTLVGKISSSRGGGGKFIYLSLTNRLTEEAVFTIARKAGLFPRIIWDSDGDRCIRHGSDLLATEERGGWTLYLPGWGEQIAIFNQMAIEAARKCGVKVNQIPASGSWMTFGGDGLRRRVIVDNGAFERAVKKSLGEGYIKNLRRMAKDLCNRAEGGKFATVRLLVVDRNTDGHFHMVGSETRAGKSALVRGLNIVTPNKLIKARALFSSTREEIEEICRLPAGSLDEVHGVTTPNEVKWTKASPGEIIEVTMVIATDEGAHQSHLDPAARVHEYDVEVFPDAWEPESLEKIKKALERGKEGVARIVADNYRPLLLQEDAEAQDGILDQNLARGYLGRPYDYEPILSALSRRLKSARWSAGANVEVVFAPFWGNYTLKPGEAILSADLKAQWEKYGSPDTFAATRWPKVSTQSIGMLHTVKDIVNGRKGLFVVVHPGVAPYMQADNDDHLQVYWDLKSRNDYKVMIETQVPVMVPGEGRLGDPSENPYVATIAGDFSTGRTGQIMGSMARALSMINRNTVDRPDLRARASEYVYSTLGVDLQSSVQGAKKPTLIRTKKEIKKILSLVETALKRHCDGKLIQPMVGVQRRTLSIEEFALRGIPLSIPMIKPEFKWTAISSEMTAVVDAFELDRVDLEKADNAGRNFETGVEAHRKLLASILKKFGAGEEFVKEMVQAISEGTVSEEQSRTLLSIGATYAQVLANREQTFPESMFWMDSVVYAMLSIAKTHK